MELTKDLIDSLFSYKDGNLISKERYLAPCVVTDAKGYKVITLFGKVYKVHRLIFLMKHGYLPEMVDHIDGNPSNNNIENLRPCDYSSNGCNRKINSNNTSGVKNVCLVKSRKKWKVDVQVRGKRKCFGYYDDLELAELVATEARNKYHGEFARHE